MSTDTIKQKRKFLKYLLIFDSQDKAVIKICSNKLRLELELEKRSYQLIKI